MAEDKSGLYCGLGGGDSVVVKSENPGSTSNHVIEVNLVNENEAENAGLPVVDAESGDQVSIPNETDEEKQADVDEESGGESADEEDDNINVVIDELKTTPEELQLKNATDNQEGKTNPEDANAESLDDKPWRQPGADISDYFNFGFDEDTWRAYGERQRRMRHNESKSGHLSFNLDKILGGLPVKDRNKSHNPGTASGSASVQRLHNVPQPMQQMRPNFPMPDQIQMNVTHHPVLLQNSNYPIPNPTLQPMYMGPHAQLQHFRPPVFVQQMPGLEKGNYFQGLQPNQFYNNTFSTPPIQNQWTDLQWKDNDARNVIGSSNNISIITINENDEMPQPSSFPSGLTQVKIEPGLPSSNICIKTEPMEEPKQVESRSRDSESHKERAHRHRSRSRSRSYEKKARYRSRSRSPSHHKN